MGVKLAHFGGSGLTPECFDADRYLTLGCDMENKYLNCVLSIIAFAARCMILFIVLWSSAVIEHFGIVVYSKHMKLIHEIMGMS